MVLNVFRKKRLSSKAFYAHMGRPAGKKAVLMSYKQLLGIENHCVSKSGRTRRVYPAQQGIVTIFMKKVIDFFNTSTISVEFVQGSPLCQTCASSADSPS
jgi:hypothetical protein